MNNNTLEFIVKMKDLMSAGFAKVAQTAQKTFTRVTSQIKAAEQGSKYFKTSLDGLKGALDDAKLYRGATRLKDEFSKATTEIKRLESEISKMEGKASGAGDSFGSYLKKGFLLATAGLSVGAAVSFAKESVGAANQYETQKTSYGVLAGNKGVGNELTSQLRGLKEDTIMGPAVYQTAQTMLGFGIAAKNVIGDVKMLGDVSMGDANKLQHLTLAFSEVQASGRLTAKEVRQMVYQGFNPLQEMSRTTGKSMGELRKEMHSGAISADMVTAAFKSATGDGGRFNNMMGTIAQTSGGKLAILQGRIASLQIAIGERLQPAVNAVVVGFTSWVTTIKHWFDIPVATQVDGQIQKIYELQLKLTSVNTSEGERVSLLKELEQINPNIVKGINAQSIEYGKLQGNINGVIGALNQKKIADKFSKDNADVIFDYNQAVKKRGDAGADMTSRLVQIAPELAGRTDLSMGQKQNIAKQKLANILNAGKGTKYFGQTTSGAGGLINNDGIAEKDQKRDFENAIKEFNAQNGIVNSLSPKYGKVQGDIKNATDSYNKVFGLDKMATAAGIKQSSEDDDGTNDKKDKKGVAGGIIGSGPRVININGVKFADKIELHASSGDAAMSMAEEKFQEMFLRVLNSGATIQ